MKKQVQLLDDNTTVVLSWQKKIVMNNFLQPCL